MPVRNCQNYKKGTGYLKPRDLGLMSSNYPANNINAVRHLNNNNNKCPGYDIKLHPVVEFRRGIMRLPLATTTSRSPLSKV